jgi:hypothetical protein
LLGLKPCGHVVSGQVRVYHADRLGSVRWVTDGSGNLVASYVYEGFGIGIEKPPGRNDWKFKIGIGVQF